MSIASDDQPPLTRATRERLQPTGDPTKTKTLRRRFTQDFNARWRAVRGDIRTTIAENDAFRLGVSRQDTPATRLGGFATRVFDTRYGSDQYRPTSLVGRNPSAGDRAAAADNWVSTVVRGRVLDPPWRGLANVRDWWATDAIRQAYLRGVGLANDDARAAGYDIAAADEPTAVATRRETTAAVEDLATLFYLDVVGATDAVRDDVLRTFMEAADDGPVNANTTTIAGRRVLTNSLRDHASKVASRVDAVGQTRTATAAATRVVQAVNTGVINQAERLRARRLGVTLETAWSTAGDAKVCEECAALEGVAWELGSADIQRPPLHPNCRCRLVITA